jgi:hypothetical protein
VSLTLLELVVVAKDFFEIPFDKFLQLCAIVNRARTEQTPRAVERESICTQGHIEDDVLFEFF